MDDPEEQNEDQITEQDKHHGPNSPAVMICVECVQLLILPVVDSPCDRQQDGGEYHRHQEQRLGEVA